MHSAVYMRAHLHGCAPSAISSPREGPVCSCVSGMLLICSVVADYLPERSGLKTLATDSVTHRRPSLEAKDHGGALRLEASNTRSEGYKSGREFSFVGNFAFQFCAKFSYNCQAAV